MADRPLNAGERAMQQYVANPGEDIDPSTVTEESEVQRRARNLVQWKMSFDTTKDPKARAVLLDELKRGAGTDFPLMGGMDGIDVATAEAGQEPNSASILRRFLGGTSVPKFESESEKALTSILKPQRPTMPPTEQPSLAYPGERQENPSGAVVGRTMRPSDRLDVRGPGSADVTTMMRIGTETGMSFAGGTLGAIGGTAVGGPPGGVVGMRAGEALGAGLGSLMSEVFDPTKEPLKEAAKAAGITLGTGIIASGGTGILRKLIGKPHEGGKELINIMAAQGKVPLPGAVLESEFVRNTQSFGSAAFGTNELLKKAQAEMEDITSAAVRDYVSGFQRFHDSSKLLFADVDAALAKPLPGTTTGIVGTPISGTAALPTAAPGAKWMLKGDDKARDAMIDVINNWIHRSGRADAMPTGLQKMYAWSQGGARPTFTFEETQQVYEALFNKARNLDFAARNRDVTEIAGTNTAAYVREQAQRVKKAFDEQIDHAIASKNIDADTKVKLQAARANWNFWLEGQEMERMIAAATKDIEGRAVMKGSALLNEIDKLARLDAKVGTTTISKGTIDNLRRYAIASRAVEESGKQGAFVLAGRVGQLVGLTGMLGGAAAGATGFGAVASFPLLAPHVIAWTFSNPHASALMIRGLKLEPGSAAAARAARELFALWEKEMLVGADRPGEQE